MKHKIGDIVGLHRNFLKKGLFKIRECCEEQNGYYITEVKSCSEFFLLYYDIDLRSVTKPKYLQSG